MAGTTLLSLMLSSAPSLTPEEWEVVNKVAEYRTKHGEAFDTMLQPCEAAATISAVGASTVAARRRR